MSQDQITQLHANIAANREFIARADVLTRLQANPDFKQIITQGYLVDEAVRLVHAKSNVALQGDEDQKAIIKQIDAIGCVEAFFREIERKARQAAKNIETDEETIVALMNEPEGDEE